MPSHLIGKEGQIRLYAEYLEVYYKDHLVERMERVRGEREARVDYRHIIGSLVRKPVAFARYRFREQMLPTITFRLAYDGLKTMRGERADVEYVRIPHLAATTKESTVDSAWRCCWSPVIPSTMARSRSWRIRRHHGHRC